jgi:acetyl esterase
MKTCLIIFVSIGSIVFSAPTLAAGRDFMDFIPDRAVVYKTVGDVELKLHVFEPPRETSKPCTVIIFFFGGGWARGNPNQFFPHCEQFASRGMLAISAEYRVRDRNGTTPFECVKDGKSAVRWVRAHAQELGIDADRIAAGGGSAGGHIAACTALVEDVEEEGEDLSISSAPNALVLFNPALDTVSKPDIAKRFDGRAEELSPAHHIRKGICPTIVLHGTGDTSVPFGASVHFTRLMKQAGNDCTLQGFGGMKHGFFNYTRSRTIFLQTLGIADSFLVDKGFLAPPDKPLEGALPPTIPTPNVIRILPGQWRPEYAFEQIAWVSPPWESDDYIWMDFPEAIFTDRGLLYLSHISTEFPQLFANLPKLDWQQIRDGIKYERKLPNGITFGGYLVKSSDNTVDLELYIANGSDTPLRNIQLQTCAYLRAIKEFADFNNDRKYVYLSGEGWTALDKAYGSGVDDGKYALGWHADGPKAAQWPVIATFSNDAERLVAMTWYTDTWTLWGNPDHPCMHADPHFPDIMPGQQKTIKGQLIFFEGSLEEFGKSYDQKYD